MSEQKNLGEIEYDFEGKTIWWPQCQKKGCDGGICFRLSEKFCYPHSAWYRPFIAMINRIISKFERD